AKVCPPLRGLLTNQPREAEVRQRGGAVGSSRGTASDLIRFAFCRGRQPLQTQIRKKEPKLIGSTGRGRRHAVLERCKLPMERCERTAAFPHPGHAGHDNADSSRKYLDLKRAVFRAFGVE